MPCRRSGDRFNGDSASLARDNIYDSSHWPIDHRDKSMSYLFYFICSFKYLISGLYGDRGILPARLVVQKGTVMVV